MEFMSHLAGGAARPSIFELVAQDEMRHLVRPALRYLLAKYAMRYPRYLLRACNNFNECYAVLLFFIERHYLREWGASFAENFYGLQRFREGERREGGSPLSGGDIRKSLAVLIGVPYMMSRLDEVYEDEAGRADLGLPSAPTNSAGQVEDWRIRWKRVGKRLLLKMWPFIHWLHHGGIFAYQIGYMFQLTRFPSPWLHLIGLQIRRSGPADYKQHEERLAERAVEEVGRLARLPFLPRQGYRLVLGAKGVMGLLRIALPMGIFFLKFLEWWYASDYYRRSSIRPIPPPPPALPLDGELAPPASPSVCAICVEERVNPAVLPSGYAFCYVCVWKWVEEKGRCPITGVAVTGEDVRKVYLSSSS